MNLRIPNLPAKLAILLVFAAFSSPRQSLGINYRDQSYSEEVFSILLNPSNDSLARPMMLLGTMSSLKLSFDILGDEAYIYNYTFIHCSHDWKPSQLQPSEYLKGYYEDQINSYRFSLNTLMPYVHHELIFPTDFMQPTLSGNYLLVVYQDRLEDNRVLFSRQFYVAEPQYAINATVPQYNRLNEYPQTHQQIDVEVPLSDFQGNIPSNSFMLNIKQDGRTDNIVVGLQPSQVYPNKLVYEYYTETLFEGGNQWRNFDIKSYKYQSEHINRILSGDDYYIVDLWEDQRRDRKNYISEIDLQGRKLIKARSDQETEIEGDYARVNFYLAWEVPLAQDEMHLLGALTDWQLGEKSRMRYNYQQKRYEASLLLKQGYYNYLYGIKEKGANKAEVELVEGSHWETQHEYFLCLYYRKPGTAYDRLVATAVVPAH